MGEQLTFERVVMKLKDLTEEKLDQFCSRLVKRNEAMIRDMKKLEANLGFDYEEADLLFIPWLVKGAIVLGKAAVSLIGKAAVGLKAFGLKAAVKATTMGTKFAAKATSMVTRVGAAATRVGAAGTRVAKPLAAKLTKVVNAGKAASKVGSRAITRFATKIAKPRNVEKFNRFIQRTKQAAKVQFKGDIMTMTQITGRSYKTRD